MEKETQKQLIKIAVTGPESTGKSWLAENLAEHFKTLWVKEYAREYLEGTGGHYNYRDILEIAKGQLRAENKTADDLRTNQFLFCDTEFIVTKIWCIVKYGRCHSFIRNQVKNHRYDLYLICDIDLPWEFDPLREHPQMREYLFDMYKSELETNDFSFVIIRGTGDDRLQEAIKAVDNLLAERKMLR
jgi:NadR type nicotinamide-nucleotide adenylyltransferase